MAVYKTGALKRVSLFATLKDSDLNKITSKCKEKTYGKNEIIFHQDDNSTNLFILIDGQVKISLIDKSGKEAILKMVYQNDYFGEMSLLDGCFRSATITSVEKSKALLISREDFLDIVQQFPEIALKMLVTLSHRLRKADEKIASLTFYDSYGKVARVLLDLMESNGNKNKEKVVLNLPYTRQQVADMAGITRETFTRILGEFQGRGCLDIEGKKIIILNPAFLEREVL